MIKININGLSPYETGLQRGKRLNELRPVINKILETMIPQSGLERKIAVEKALRLSSVIKEELPDVYAEMEGIVAGSQWNLEEYSLYHNSLILSKKEIQCCSNIFLSEERTESGETILAKNKDLPSLFYDCQELTSVYNKKYLSYICLRNAGWPGCDQGVNEAGLSFILSSAHTGEYSTGIHSYILGSIILARASHVDEALKILESYTTTGETSFIISDAQGQGAIFECGHCKQYNRLESENGILICTNHYQSKELRKKTEHLKSSNNRWRRLNELYHCQEKFSVDYILNSLMEHNDPKDFYCICRHDDTMSTLATILIFPQKKTMQIQMGNPCEKQGFHEYQPPTIQSYQQFEPLY
ncbi:MAG: C45 family peptidase [Spirochaetota bacterium]|nr:C45 family peptidase [Spirochaetota bacterium]